MKKLSTLLLMAALAAPMISADEVTLNPNLYIKKGGSNTSGFIASDNSFCGTATATITYDEATGLYTMPNFLGFEKANLQFQLPDAPTRENEGITCTPVAVKFPDESDPENIIIKGNTAGSKFGFNIDNDLSEMNIWGSFVFKSNDLDWRINVGGGIWCLSTENLTLNAIIGRTYAVKSATSTKVYLQVTVTEWWIKESDEPETSASWTRMNDDNGMFYINFEIPASSGSQTSLEEISSEQNAPVEYFNLQGIRVDNPENGLYIRRQGSKIQKVVIR